MKIYREVRPERLGRNAAMDGCAIDDRQKPDNPSAGIIGVAGENCSTHETLSCARMACHAVVRQDAASRPDRRECHPAPGAGLRADRGERVAAAGTVRRQPCPAVGADLPVRGELALALVALVEELVKLLLELPECGLHPALLGLLLLLFVVHGLSPVSHRLHLGHSGVGRHAYPGNTRLCLEYAHGRTRRQMPQA